MKCLLVVQNTSDCNVVYHANKTASHTDSVLCRGEDSSPNGKKNVRVMLTGTNRRRKDKKNNISGWRGVDQRFHLYVRVIDSC